jgi:hypothetical protein
MLIYRGILVVASPPLRATTQCIRTEKLASMSNSTQKKPALTGSRKLIQEDLMLGGQVDAYKLNYALVKLEDLIQRETL